MAAARAQLRALQRGLPSANSFNARLGDGVEFYDVQTVTYKTSASVAAIDRVHDHAVLAEVTRAMMDVNAQCKGGCGLFVSRTSSIPYPVPRHIAMTDMDKVVSSVGRSSYPSKQSDSRPRHRHRRRLSNLSPSVELEQLNR